jgi:hypothetical protein
VRPTTHHPQRLLASLASSAAVAALVLGALAAAPPAAAATTVTLTGVQANGQAGVPQNLVVTAAPDGAPCGSVLPPAATIYAAVTGATQALGTATFAVCIGDAYQYTYQWVPASASILYLSAAVADGTSTSIRSAIAAVPTTTRIQAPGTIKLGQQTTLTASVTAGNGSLLSPQGTIQFSVVGGGSIGGPVALNNAVPSTVQIQWTPAVLGTMSLVATYKPGIVNGVVSTTCGSSCTSAPDAVSVTSSGVNMYLANPPSYSAGSAATLTAVVSVVPPSGSVTFTVNGAAIAKNVPVQSNGQAQTVWTPPAPGNYTIGASWAGSGSLTGTAQETVSVGAAPTQGDQILIVTAAGTTLTAGATYTGANGSSISFTSSTSSGSPVAFTPSGPCTIAAGVFTVNQGNGQCRVTATSPGGNGYGPASATVTVNLVPGSQTAKLAAPKSGNINVGKTLTLEKPNQGKTNAGQPISWKITKGKNTICQLKFPSNGSVKLKMLKKGKCTVQASAKAVSGQWNAYKLTRNYTGI